jgi:hypothetical protein
MSVDGVTPSAPTQSAIVAADRCPNCEHALAQPRPNYCSHCGQETNLKPPTLLEFAQQFGGNYLAMEGALWRSLKLLLFRPGQLTREYFVGRKRRYVLPLRLYLTVSLIALLALRLSGMVMGPSESAVQVKLDKPGELDNVVLRLGQRQAGLRNGQFFCEDLPAVVCERVRARITLNPQAMEQALRQLPQRMVANWGTVMFALLPLFAAQLKLVYLRRGMRWSEHLVFALHLHAFWFAMLATEAARLPWLQALAALAVPVYSVLALQRVYGGRWWATALRSVALCTLYGTTLVVALVVVALWAFFA